MNCPHCNQPIDDAAIAAHLAAKGGRKSKRTITPEQRRKMQEGKEAKRANRYCGACSMVCTTDASPGETLTCDRCGHQWIARPPRAKADPCPNCGSYGGNEGCDQCRP